MKFLKKIVPFLLVVFVGIQFIPTKRNQSTEVLESDFSKTFTVPANIQNMFEKSCYDCHSNNTNYPWYNKIQPISWLLENHIKEGKKEFNFSEFGAYSKRKQKNKLKSLASQIRDNEMPMQSYTLIHSDAKLSDSDKEQIIVWVNKLRDGL